jgi:hypothetical protein
MAPNGVITNSDHHWLTCPLLVVTATSDNNHWLTLAIMPPLTVVATFGRQALTFDLPLAVMET